MSVIKMADLDLAGKRVLIRQDLNVPLKRGVVADGTHEQLLATSPLYQDIYESQLGGGVTAGIDLEEAGA